MSKICQKMSVPNFSFNDLVYGSKYFGFIEQLENRPYERPEINEIKIKIYPVKMFSRNQKKVYKIKKIKIRERSFKRLYVRLSFKVGFVSKDKYLFLILRFICFF